MQTAQHGAWLPAELRRRPGDATGAHANLARQRKRLLDAYVAGVIVLAVFEHKDGELRERQADLLRQQQEITAQSERLSRGLDQASFPQRRQLVELLLDCVVVSNNEVEIRYAILTTEASTQTRFCHLHSDYLE